MDRAEPFNPVSGICNLCTLEKFYLIFKPETYTINKNDEINSYCLHKEAQLLENTWIPGDMDEFFGNVILMYNVIFC